MDSPEPGSPAQPPLIGTVRTIRPRALYDVQLADGSRVIAHLAREFKRLSVGLLVGDTVHVVRSRNDPTRARLIGKAPRQDR